MLLFAMTFVSCGDDEPETKIKGIYSVLPGNKTNYSTTTDHYFKFDVLSDNGRYLEVHNEQYSGGKSFTMRINLSNCSRYVINSSYSFEGKNLEITPDYYYGGSWVPNDNDGIVTNVVIKFDTSKKTYELSYEHGGVATSASGELYIGK